MSNIKNAALDIIFPRRCVGCEVLLATPQLSYICRACLKTIAFMNHFACAFCKSPAKDGQTCPYCAKNHFLDKLWVTASYENHLVETIIKTMKYRFIKSLANDIAELMSGYLRKKLADGSKIDAGMTIVTSVPLGRGRLNWRGFNQSEVIAEKIAGSLGLPVFTNLLLRSGNAKPQADMPDKESRIKNMSGMFKLNSNHESAVFVAGKTVLLVDDISTTGSTLNDCARALKGAGAREVIGFVFARGTPETRKKGIK